MHVRVSIYFFAEKRMWRAINMLIETSPDQRTFHRDSNNQVWRQLGAQNRSGRQNTVVSRKLPPINESPSFVPENEGQSGAKSSQEKSEQSSEKRPTKYFKKKPMNMKSGGRSPEAEGNAILNS